VRRSRRHRELPLPLSFKRERGEHWLVRHEREVDEHQEALRKAGDRPPKASITAASTATGSALIINTTSGAEHNLVPPIGPNTRSS
jgi:hypothetical protein